AAAAQALLAVVGDQHRVQTLRVGKPLDDRNQIEITIGDVKGDDAAGFHVPAIDRQRLVGQEVDGDRIAGEGVYRQQIEALRRLTLEIEPGIAERCLDR